MTVIRLKEVIRLKNRCFEVFIVFDRKKHSYEKCTKSEGTYRDKWKKEQNYLLRKYSKMTHQEKKRIKEEY
jgi:hypothetical protein